MSGTVHAFPASRMSTREMFTRSLNVTPKPVDETDLCGALRDAMTACAYIVCGVEGKRALDAQDWHDADLALFEAARNLAAFRGRQS